MKTNGESKFSDLLIGLGLGAIGGLIFALLARKETRELLRESAEAVVEKGRKFMSHQCDAVDTHTEAEEQAYQEERRETLGG